MPPENDSDSKSIFDLPPEEAAKRLQESPDKLKKKLFANGLPITYQEERCQSEDYFIQEYDGCSRSSVFIGQQKAYLPFGKRSFIEGTITKLFFKF